MNRLWACILRLVLGFDRELAMAILLAIGPSRGISLATSFFALKINQ
jgi:hypothetical protein